VKGHRIAYLDVGGGSPVILLHGFGGSMWQWEYQQDALAPFHRVLTPDLIGSGLSDKPDIAYTPTDMVEYLREFMDAAGIQRASLVGNSLGAGVGIGMALTYPERVDRLVLISGFPKGVKDQLASPLFKRAADSWMPTWLVRFGNWLLGRGVTERILQEVVYDHALLTPAVLERAYQNRQRPGLIPPIMALTENLPAWEQGLAQRLGEIKRPTLIIWGDKDKVFPPEVGRGLQAAIAGSTLTVVSNAGHIPQWERPDVVNPLLVKFLQP